MLIDSHAHLNFSEYCQDLTEAIERSKKAQVEAIISVGTDYQGSLSSLEVAKKHPAVFSTIGLHPSASPQNIMKNLASLKELAKKSVKIVAVGECGLDYYRQQENETYQQELFLSQLVLAEKLNLPVIIHIRNGHDEKAVKDAYQILKNKHQPGVIHCFTLSDKWAKQFLDLGFYLGFTGVITYPKTADLAEVVKKTPLDRILIETDSPYLAPQKYRGKRNEPAYVEEVAGRIAEIKAITFKEVAETTTFNAKRLFGI